ncbi:hypothetical protein E2C01_076441 [Portunus trituberculatus]|uniref:Uncharacterized protein n=1 Tax=Portunus trituberculatus TaxID=210409 RepID=A0A5B7IIJ2_PORTR|nr:hypothetical protein [Portunus trituberculatus]
MKITLVLKFWRVKAEGNHTWVVLVVLAGRQKIDLERSSSTSSTLEANTDWRAEEDQFSLSPGTPAPPRLHLTSTSSSPRHIITPTISKR